MNKRSKKSRRRREYTLICDHCGTRWSSVLRRKGSICDNQIYMRTRRGYSWIVCKNRLSMVAGPANKGFKPDIPFDFYLLLHTFSGNARPATLDVSKSEESNAKRRK
jgi:hypothetical protein